MEANTLTQKANEKYNGEKLLAGGQTPNSDLDSNFELAVVVANNVDF